MSVSLTSLKLFDYVLRRKFADDLELPEFVRSGHYVLRDCSTYREVPLGSRYAQIFRPGARLVMTLTLRYDEGYADCCPRCQMPDRGVEDITTPCHCGIVYTRAKQPKSFVIMLPSHSSLLDAPGHGASLFDTCIPEETNSPLPVFGPMLEQAEEAAVDTPTFNDAANIKNVDFSAPPMVMVKDLLGFVYLVPWHIARTLDGIRFFLKWCTAGGRILGWPRDCMIFDEFENQLTPDNWLVLAQPGSLLTMRLREFAGTGTLRQLFASRVSSILSASRLTLRHDNITAATEEACLLIGAADAQAQLKDFIRSAVTAEWLSAGQPTVPEEPNIVDEASHCRCLICCREFEASFILAKHAQSHLAPLRCQDECVSCDATNLPYFLGEDVSQRDCDERSRSVVSSSI